MTPSGTHDISAGYRRWALILLASVYVVNYLDRQVLAILLEPIKQEFRVSDSALGLLVGPTFALFYATLGLPLAWLADRSNRRNLIATCVALFSATTLACGLVTQFWQLILARVGTGVGEAGTGPSSQAIIADLYPPETRAAAQSVYASGVNVGLMIAFFGGAWIAQHYGWRAAFATAALPGLVLAVLVRFTLREPPRGASERLTDTSAPTLRETGTFMRSQRAYRFIVLGTSMSAIAGYGTTAFLPAFLSRSHHLSLPEIGFIFAMILGIGGALSTLASGAVADRLAKRDRRWYMWVPSLAVLVSLPFWPAFLLWPTTQGAIVASIVPLALSAAWMGPCVAMIQGLAPLRMRAQAAATQLFIGNLIGLGIGPQAVGIVSDLLQPKYGSDSLRYALFTCVIASSLSALCYFAAGRTLRADLARAQARSAAASS